jgi:hypothetical protein
MLAAAAALFDCAETAGFSDGGEGFSATFAAGGLAELLGGGGAWPQPAPRIESIAHATTTDNLREQ